MHLPGVQVKHHFWITWAEIAISQETAAQDARAAAVEAHAEGHEFAPHIAPELHASMITVAASAHAIDALYGAVKPLIPLPQSLLTAWTTNGASRHTRIRETLQTGFKVPNTTSAAWKKEFTWLFGLRDKEVHFEEAFDAFVSHPVLPTGVAPEMALYSVESSKRALDLLFQVFDHTLKAGAGRNQETEQYGKDNSASRERLQALRCKPAGSP